MNFKILYGELKKSLFNKEKLNFVFSAGLILLIFYSLPNSLIYNVIKLLGLSIFIIISFLNSKKNLTNRMNLIEKWFNFYNELFLGAIAILYFLVLLKWFNVTAFLVIFFAIVFVLFLLTFSISTFLKIQEFKEVILSYFALVSSLILLFSIFFILFNGVRENELTELKNGTTFDYVYFSINNFYSSSYGDLISVEGKIMKSAVLLEVVTSSFIHIFVIANAFDKLKK